MGNAVFLFWLVAVPQQRGCAYQLVPSVTSLLGAISYFAPGGLLFF